ncbi:MAG: lytic transglycosylase domain-containing protein [Pseudomonadota bacterium]
MKARLLTCGLVIVAGLIAGPVRADIYAYTGPDGTIHFSNVPDDPHYRLIVRTPVEPSASSPSASSAARWLAHSADFDAAIQRAAFASEVHPALLRAVIVVESGFNPRAISRRGAVGLMQLMPSTARRYGAFNAFDPEQNIHAGASYLAALITRFGSENLELVLAAYNAGEAAVEKYGRQIPPYRETRLYVPNVLKMYHALLELAPEPVAGNES